MLERLAYAVIIGIVAAVVVAVIVFNVPGLASFSWAIAVIGVLAGVVTFFGRTRTQL